MERVQVDLPRGRIPHSEAAAIHQLRGQAELAQAPRDVVLLALGSIAAGYPFYELFAGHEVGHFFRGSLRHSYLPIAFRDRLSMLEKHFVIPPLLAAAKSLGMTDRLMRLGSRLGIID